MPDLKDRWLQETLGVSEENLALKTAPVQEGSSWDDGVTDVQTPQRGGSKSGATPSLARSTATKPKPRGAGASVAPDAETPVPTVDLDRAGDVPLPTISPPARAITAKAEKMSKEDIKEGLAQIRLDLDSIQKSINSFWTNYDKGLDVFSNIMTDARINDLKPEHLSFFDNLVKNGLDVVKDAIKSAVPGATLIIAVVDSRDTTPPELPSGGKSVTDYVNSLKTSLGEKRDEMLGKFDPNGGPIPEQYRELAGRDAAEAAQYAKEVAGAVKGFKAMVKKCNTTYFKQKFAVEFATKQGASREDGKGGKGGDKGKGKGRKEDSTLYFRVYLHMTGDGKKPRFEVVGASPKWKLVRKGSKAEAQGAASALVDAYENQPWKSAVPKKVAIHITRDRGQAEKGYSGNYEHSGWLVTGKDGGDDVVACEDVKGQEKLLREAWAHSEVKKKPKENKEIEGATK